jgi:hypothetical protein
VWVKRGVCSADSLINIALCCLGVLPGLLHAWYIILQNPDPHDGYQRANDGERAEGGTTYYVVSHTGGPASRPGAATMNYGTVAGQQRSGANNSQSKKGSKGPAQPPAHASAQNQGGEGSSRQPEGPPPTYADAVKGDHKVQGP